MIEISHMNYGYNLKEKLYEDFSFKFEKGKVYGILGKNGSGKTTLLNIITSLLPNYSGNVAINNLEAKDRKREYLKQFYYMPEISTEKNLKVSDLISIGQCYENWDKEKFLDLVKREKLDLNKKIKTLSKGWKKRLDFYLAIAINPDILILDEVTEGVDILAQKSMINDILEYFDEEKTVIIASHHIEEFENVIDDFIIIDSGKLLYSGIKEYIYQNFGWLDDDSLSGISKEDILIEKKILGTPYSLIQNIDIYKGKKFKSIDLATFLQLMIDQGGDKKCIQ